MDTQCVLFIHVPKAGGTTLHEIIERQYSDKHTLEIHPAYTHDEAFDVLKKMSHEQRKKLQIIKGHMPFGLHRHLSQPFTYITFLRDPVKRVISNYYYLISNPGHAMYDVVTESNLSLKEFISSNLTPENDNYQTRMLSGMNTDRFDFGKKPIEPCTEENYRTAIDNIEKYFKVVGITRRFDESLLVLKHELQWQNIYYFKKKVNTGNKEEVDPETIELIQEKNKFDFRLYQYAEERLQISLDAIPRFNDKLKRFKRYNHIYKNALKIPYSIYTRITNVR